MTVSSNHFWFSIISFLPGVCGSIFLMDPLDALDLLKAPEEWGEDEEGPVLSPNWN